MTHGLVLGPAAFAYVFLFSGFCVVRRYFPTCRGIEAFGLALATGLFGVSFIAYTSAALSHSWLTPQYLVAVATGLNAAAAVLARREWSALLTSIASTRGLVLLPSRRTMLAVAAGVVLPGLFFAQHYTRSEFALNCVNFSSAYVTGVPPTTRSSLSGERNEILTLEAEEQEGVTPLFVGLPALFGFLGYRLSFAAVRVVILLLAYGLAKRFGGTHRQAIAYAGILLFNSLILDVTGIDQNVLCLATILASLYCLLAPEPRPLLAGIFYAFAWGARHHLLLGVGGPFLLVWGLPHRRRAIAQLAVGLALPTSFFALHHALVYGSLVHHESLRHFPLAIPHRFMGFDFEIHTLLAWPFIESLMRTPFAAQPSLTLYPLVLPTHLGTFLTAILLLGWGHLLRRRAQMFGALALLILPPTALLMVQGNWMEPEKVRFFIAHMGPALLPLVAGFGLLRRSVAGLRAWATVVTVALALIPAMEWLRDLRFPVDPREYIGRPDFPVEAEPDYEFVRSTGLLPVGLQPRLSLRAVFEMHPRELLEELQEPTYEAREAPFPIRITELFKGAYPAGARGENELVAPWKPRDPADYPTRALRHVEISLSARPTAATEWVREVGSASGALLDVGTSIDDVALRNVTAAGLDSPIDIVALRSRDGHGQTAFVAVVNRPSATLGVSSPTPLDADRFYLTMARDADLVLSFMPSVHPVTFLGWLVEFPEGSPPILTPLR